ncbi:LCA5L protein, partial [Alaudala cheleensis]|nr:LCA5L protein [Alaudala cheleensis]
GGKKWPAAKTCHLNSSFPTLPSGLAHQDKNATGQRISSATKHKITELKNEIFDLQRKIEEASSENQALRDVSRRQARAIDKYSNAESRLQGLMAGHRHDVRELRKLLRTAQEAEKNTARELKRVEAELRRTKGDLKTLVVLSEDKELAEREELSRRLSVLNEALEAKEERIQSLEMQLKLNNGIFTRQLASESKKIMEATRITNDLLVEINIVQQKIKEKDRQLYVRNIYANRMPKALRDRSDWVPNGQIDRSVQVDKESLRELLLSQHQETEKNPIQEKKEKRGDEGGEGKAKEVCSDAQGEKEKQGTKKAPMPQNSNRTHREFIKEMEKQTEFFEQELKSLTKSEQNPPSDRVKDNNQKGEVEKEEKKPHEQQKKKARSESVVPSKDPTRLKKNPTFPGAAENLHQGLHVSGAKSRAGSLRQAGQSCSNSPVPRGRLSFGHYEPSFGYIPLGRQE